MKENITKMLQSEHEEERVSALRSARKKNLALNTHTLEQALGDGSWRVRKEAVECFLAQTGTAVDARDAIKLLHSEDNAGLRNAAMEILVRLGRQGISALEAEMASDNHDVRKFVVDILGEIGDETCVGTLIRALEDPDANVRSAAAENLGKLRAREAIPALLDAMNSDDFGWRFTILEALSAMDERIPMFRLSPFVADKLLRKALFDCLGNVGDLDAIPILVDGLEDDMRKCREAAVLGLARLAEVYPREVSAALGALKNSGTSQAVAELLGHRDRVVQEAAVRLLGWIGDGSVAERMLLLLGDEVNGTLVLEALQNFGNEVLCNLVVQNLGRDPAKDIFLVYLAGISHCDAVAEKVERGMRSDDEQMRMVTARTLAAIGGAGSMPELIAALGDPSAEVVQLATDALVAIGSRHPKEIVAQMADLTENVAPEIRACAVQIMGRIGCGDCHAQLSLAFKDESPLVRQAAVRVLDVLAPADREGLLVLALTDEEPEVRALAAEALGELEGERVIDSLALSLGDEDIWVRANSVRSLGKIKEERSVSLICAALEDPVGLVAIAALESLREMDAVPSIESLKRALTHPDEEVVKAALQGMEHSAPGPWIDEVSSKMIDHGKWDVRLAVLNLLEQFDVTPFRDLLEKRLAVEGDDLVRQKISDLLARPAAMEN